MIWPSPIAFVSLQAPCADSFCAALARWLGRRTGLALRWDATPSWQRRAARLDRGDAGLAFICGLPCLKRQARGAPLELLAAPVMRGARYGDQPVYYSDVVVRADANFADFEDLRGARWAYNEPDSHSGYNITRYELARRGLDTRYFGDFIQAGSHQRSLAMILSGQADAAAIDSTVFEAQLAARPRLGQALRRIAVFGPSPAPALAVSRRLPAADRKRLREAMVSAHRDPQGRRALAAYGIARLAAVDSSHYTPIEAMYRRATGRSLS